MLAACTAVWVGYSVWAAAAPEILDFRLAPLWGFLLALTPLPVVRPARAPGQPESVLEGLAPPRTAARGETGDER